MYITEVKSTAEPEKIQLSHYSHYALRCLQLFKAVYLKMRPQHKQRIQQVV